MLADHAVPNNGMGGPLPTMDHGARRIVTIIANCDVVVSIMAQPMFDRNARKIVDALASLALFASQHIAVVGEAAVSNVAPRAEDVIGDGVVFTTFHDMSFDVIVDRL